MSGWHVSWNLGMGAALVLLAAGGGLMLFAGDGRGALHTLGFGIVLLAGVVYLGARIAMLIRERRS